MKIFVTSGLALAWTCAKICTQQVSFSPHANANRSLAVTKRLAIAETCGHDDQVALNLYARERRMPMPLEWNHRAFFKLQQIPAIVYFTGPKKPWTKGLSVALWSKLITN